MSSSKPAPRLTSAQQYQAYGLLLKYVIKRGDGTSLYTEGWSDARIAQEVGCKPLQIGAMRAREMGPLYMRGSTKSPPDPANGVLKDLADRVEVLEELERGLTSQFLDIQETMETLVRRVAYLEKELGVTPE